MRACTNGVWRRAISKAVIGGRSFGADATGTTAVEFGIVATPFFMMLFGIISVGFYFFTTFTLENAVEKSSRYVRTGQMQTVDTSSGSPNYSGTAMSGSCQNAAGAIPADTLGQCFNKIVCANLPTYMNCSGGKVTVYVQNFSDFASVTPVTCLNASNALATPPANSYSPGGTSSVVLVTTCYEWQLAGSMPFLRLGHMNNGSALIQASTTFMTEPY